MASKIFRMNITCKIIITLLLAILGGNISFGKTIKGIVLSDADSTAVIGAQCRLKVDTMVIARGVTGEDGKFTLATDNKANATLKVSIIGYGETTVQLPSGRGDIDLGELFLTEGIALGEVTVNGGTVVDSKGRTLVYPSASQVRASDTSLSLFQKLGLPGLTVNPINRSISVDRGQPTVLVNGIPATMDDVNAIQPKDIARIEYSQFTPARYADKGTNGLINIVLKKREDGGSFYGWMRDCPYIGFLDANIQAAYHQGPSRFTLSYSPSWRDVAKVEDITEKSYIGDDFQVNLEERTHSPFMYLTNDVKFKYDYAPSAKTTFSAAFNARIFKDDRKSDGFTSDSALGEYVNHNKSHSNSFTPSLDLFLHHELNDNNSLEVQVVGTLNSDKYHRHNEYLYHDGARGEFPIDVNTKRRSLITEVNYTHSFSPVSTLSAGIQNTMSHNKNTYLSTDYAPLLTENNNYVYVTYGHQINKVYLSASTGAKLFWMENDLNKRHFIKNLSQAQLNWNINQSWSISASFRYTPSIPSLASLTDYPQQLTPYLVSNGNPHLKVSDMFNYSITPRFSYKNFKAALSLAYVHINNPWISDTRYIGDRLFLSQSVNTPDYNEAYGYLALEIADLYGFGAQAQIGLEHYHTAGNGWKHDLTSVSAMIYLYWNKGPWTISYWRKFPGKSLYGHTVSRAENGDALGVSYKPNSHWTASAQWMYMFECGGTYYPSWDYSPGAPSVSRRHIKDNANMVVLSLTYSTDFGSIFRSSRRSLNNSDSGSSLLKL